MHSTSTPRAKLRSSFDPLGWQVGLAENRGHAGKRSVDRRRSHGRGAVTADHVGHRVEPSPLVVGEDHFPPSRPRVDQDQRLGYRNQLAPERIKGSLSSMS
jgi:hypothetical protein